MTQQDTGRDTRPAAAAERVEATAVDPYGSRRDRAFKIQQAVSLVAGVVEILLAFRFVLRLLAANAESGFVSFVYGVTAPLVAPFVGIFGAPVFQGSVFEPHAIVAIVVYALVAWGLIRLDWIVFGETRTGMMTTTEKSSTKVR